jgi:hypothetical protein
MLSFWGQFKNPVLYKYIEHTYSAYPILKRNDVVFPVAVFPKDKLNLNLVSLECGSGSIRSPKYRILKDRYDSEVTGIDIESRENRFKDVSIYTMEAFKEGSGELSCGIGKYCDILETCDSLEYELLETLASGHSLLADIKKRTILRNRLHSVSPDPIRYGKGRVNGMAISCLLAFMEGADLKMMFLRRSPDTVAIHSGMKHVVPSGFFETLGNYERDFNIKDNVLKEYVEELFNFPDFPKNYKPLDIRSHIQDQGPVAYLEKLISKGSASFHITGLAVNLLNLRPEICALLFIRDKEWWDTHYNGSKMKFRFNEEILRNSVLPYSKDDDILLKYLNPQDMIPPGAAATWMGLDKMRELI